MNTPSAYLTGVAGGTGSGKTTLAQCLRSLIGPNEVTVVEADYYYHDLSHMPADRRHLVNFDHPDALDIDLMAAHLQELRQGRAVRMSAYDFTTHCRTNTMFSLLPRPIILVEGILVLACPAIVSLLDLKVYIDERADARMSRRMLRDMQERGRTPEMSARQYAAHVRPMHARYVEPSKQQADIILASSADTHLLLPLMHAALAERAAGIPTDHTAASQKT